MTSLMVEGAEYDGIPGARPAFAERWLRVSGMLILGVGLGSIRCGLLIAVSCSCASKRQGEKKDATPCHASLR